MSKLALVFHKEAKGTFSQQAEMQQGLKYRQHKAIYVSFREHEQMTLWNIKRHDEQSKISKRSGGFGFSGGATHTTFT